MNLRGQQRREFPLKVRKLAFARCCKNGTIPFKRRPMPDAELLRALFSYDLETGIFTRLTGQFAGVKAGSIDRKGYRIIKISGIGFKAHRLAWKYVTGTEPEDDIDHRNTNKDENWWTNLRPSDQSQNSANSRLRKDNQSGFKGVSKVCRSPKWQARIRKSGKLIYLGIFDSPEDAHAAYLKAAKILHGEFSNGGTV